MTQYESLTVALARLESAMRAGDLWKQPSPAPAAFESQQPFCVDTMEMGQWLRFVMVPRLQALMDANRPLPDNAEITPAAELYLKEQRTSVRLPILEALRDVDSVLVSGALRETPQ